MNVFALLILIVYAAFVNWRYFSCHREARYESLVPVSGILTERTRDIYTQTISVTRNSAAAPVDPEYYDYMEVLTDGEVEVLKCRYACPPEKKCRKHPLPAIGKDYLVYVLDEKGSRTFQYADPSYQYDRISCFSLAALVLTDLFTAAACACFLYSVILPLL